MFVTCMRIGATVAVASIHHAFSNFCKRVIREQAAKPLTLVLEARGGTQMRLIHHQMLGNVVSAFPEPVD
jgi:hypothetical protein